MHNRVFQLSQLSQLRLLGQLGIVSLCLFVSACAEGTDDGGASFGGFTTQPTGPDDMGDGDGDEDTTSGDGDPATGDGDGDPTTGDGDGDPTTGDGDGDPTTGDGDGDPTTGDGDGDPTTGDGDGDPPPPTCGNGAIDAGETCDGNNFGGATCVAVGYDQGTLTCSANCTVSTASCSNAAQPGLGQLYSPCLLPENCPNLDGCVTVSMQGDPDPYDGYCTNFCVSDAECNTNTGGTAVPKCNTEASPYCELDCSGGKTCPGGMMCTGLQGGKFICY